MYPSGNRLREHCENLIRKQGNRLVAPVGAFLSPDRLVMFYNKSKTRWARALHSARSC